MVGKYNRMASQVLVGSLATTAGASDAPIQEIVVTAQKVAESIQDVPQAVSAFDADTLDQLQLSTASELQFHVPNLSYSDTETGVPNFTLRGVGSHSSIGGADAGVGIHVNDVYVNSGAMGGALFDIEQVMVLRGPQGTLYGRNSTGGAINIITRRPAEYFEGYLEASMGSFDRNAVEGALSIPMTDTLGLRLAALYTRSDGNIKNTFSGKRINGDDVLILRPTLRINAGDNTRIDLIASYLKSDTDNLGFDSVACARDTNSALGCLASRRGNDSPHPMATVGGLGLIGAGYSDGDPFGTSKHHSDPYRAHMDLDPANSDELADLTIDIQHSFKAGSFNSLSAVLSQRSHALRDSDFLAPGELFEEWIGLSRYSPDLSGASGGHLFGTYNHAFGYTDARSKERQYLQEFRFRSDTGGAHDYLLGLFYMETDLQSRYMQATTGLDAYAQILQSTGSPSLPPYFLDENKRADVSSAALFGEYYRVLDRNLQLTLGARWTHDTKDIDHRSLAFDLEDPASAQPPLDASTQRRGRRQFKVFTGRAGLDWTPQLPWTDDSLVYAFLSRGYRAGGLNEAGSLQGEDYDPEIVHTLEIGSKNRLLDGSALLNATVFGYDYRNMQVFDAGMFNTDAQVAGAEFEYAQQFNARWSADLSLAYLHTRIEDGAAINQRDPGAGDSEHAVLGDIEGNNCIVARQRFLDPLEHGGMGGDPFALARRFETCDQAGLAAGLETSLRGNALANAPRWNARAGLQYQTGFWQHHYLLLRADIYWQSDFYARAFNDGADRIKPWRLLNVFAEVGSEAGYYLRLGTTNLLDDAYITGLELRPAASGLSSNLHLLEQRALSLTAGLRF